MASENAPPLYLAPEALQSLQTLPSNNPQVLSQRTTINVDPEILAGMAAALGTPLYAGKLAIVLSAGKGLKPFNPEVPYKEAGPDHPYVLATDIPPVDALEMPAAIPKSQLEDRRVREVTVHNWTPEHLSAQTAFALREEFLRVRRRNRYMRVAGGIGAMIAAGTMSYATKDLWWLIGVGLSCLYVVGEVFTGSIKDSKAYTAQEHVARDHNPYTIIRK